MKVLAVGDIHTKLWIIMNVEKVIDKYDKVVFVGDYADDWNATAWDSLYTWSALMMLQDKFPDKVHLVTGNHDYIYVNQTPTLQSGYSTITQLVINMPENSRVKEWLQDLPIEVNIDGVTYSHAGLYFNWKDNDELWSDYSPLWTRPENTTYKHIPQVFGHTPSKTCWEVQPNVWCIDTFSTYRDGTPIGDHTVLEIIDGKTFKKIKLETKDDNNSISGVAS